MKRVYAYCQFSKQSHPKRVNFYVNPSILIVNTIQWFMAMLATSEKTQSFTGKFHFQKIHNPQNEKQGWYEMLYRPENLCAGFGVENYFLNMTESQQYCFDLLALNYLSKTDLPNKIKKVSINVSPANISNNRFLQYLLNMIQRGQIIPQHLCLEIVESNRLRQLNSECVHALNQLRELGVWIALDDFGTGYAHWELLKLGLVDVVKICNNNVDKSTPPIQFLAGLAAFAQSLKLITVLEGIETKRDFAQGVKIGIQNYQGYYFN